MKIPVLHADAIGAEIAAVAMPIILAINPLNKA